MYDDDRPHGGSVSTLADELLEEVVSSTELRPRCLVR